MAKNKRSRQQQECDLDLIAGWYLKGKSQLQIVEELNKFHLGIAKPPVPYITRTQVSYDIQKLYKLWKESSARKIDELKAEQLAKIDAVEAQAWEAWEKSLAEKKEQRTSKRTGSSEKGPIDISQAQITKSDMLGNPAYLQIIDKCVERRCKLLGLDAPIKVDTAITFTIKLPDNFPAPDMTKLADATADNH